MSSSTHPPHPLHPPHPAAPLRVATLTLSDTRTPDDDDGGRLLGDLLRAAGFAVVSHAILREEPALLAETIARLCDEGTADAIVLTGGTGIAPRDRTIEALTPLLEKTIDGFGEAFRRLSWDQIGPNAILSRALAGVVRGRIVVALPGSPKALDLAVTRILAPVLPHAVALASGRGGHHHHGDKAARTEPRG
ncbi:MogA/MoaB family molybdenum cofactor biosynthesis protein [Chondromyces apiculatus]|uniref:Molybdenum cofactor biosynthesis protein B n=1 Tax=Chondromyces apiculatus DSM 436 TaxID=1192034 RepID=A0A017SZA2_9BACT|nr:MogA/MoaB family molybdenum cofactor biosynthesis protein [Chondromyces apiculatus]EYF02062.1 Molybdenum cofactor biosynthesis protein MoaB [Chondromyces apiculatus DSM 436]